MDTRELINFIRLENRRLRERYSDADEQRTILVQTVKLNEEIGELCDQILARDSLQRDEKLNQFESGDMEAEFADVLITTLLLADSADIDIETALEQKIEKISQRYD